MGLDDVVPLDTEAVGSLSSRGPEPIDIMMRNLRL